MLFDDKKWLINDNIAYNKRENFIYKTKHMHNKGINIIL